MNTISPTSENVIRMALMGNGRFRYSGARWLSHLGSPPLTVFAALLLCVFAAKQTYSAAATAVYTALAFIFPLLVVLWLYRQGTISDIYIKSRSERFWPNLSLVLGSLLGWLFMTYTEAPTFLVLFAVVVLIQAITSFFITIYWKISMHCAGAATLMTVALFVMGTPVPLILLPFLIAWSRIYLNRHTPAQTIGGVLMGCLITVIVLTSGI